MTLSDDFDFNVGHNSFVRGLQTLKLVPFDAVAPSATFGVQTCQIPDLCLLFISAVNLNINREEGGVVRVRVLLPSSVSGHKSSQIPTTQKIDSKLPTYQKMRKELTKLDPLSADFSYLPTRSYDRSSGLSILNRNPVTPSSPSSSAAAAKAIMTWPKATKTQSLHSKIPTA